jgi:metal-responsive CopG/Arc/MetJ family transcriptional regulator
MAKQGKKSRAEKVKEKVQDLVGKKKEEKKTKEEKIKEITLYYKNMRVGNYESKHCKIKVDVFGITIREKKQEIYIPMSNIERLIVNYK